MIVYFENNLNNHCGKELYLDKYKKFTSFFKILIIKYLTDESPFY